MADFDPKLLAEQYKPENFWKEVDEAYFLQAGLPTALKRLTGKEVDTGYWAAMAGNEFKGVHVMRDGKRLFTAPPIASPVRIETGAEFFEMVHKIAKTRDTNVLPSDDKLRTILQKESTKLKLNSFKVELLTWIKIFTYYGVKMTLVEETVVAELPPAEEADIEWM